MSGRRNSGKVPNSSKIPDSAIKKEDCPSCKKVVSDEDLALQCEICNKWLHIICADLTEAEYTFLQEHKAVHWFCEQCIKNITSVIKSGVTINQNQEKLEKKFDNMNENYQKRMSELDKEFKILSAKVLAIDSQKIVADVDKELKNLAAKVMETDTKIETAIEAKLIDSLAKPSFASIVAAEVDNKFSKVSVDVSKVQGALEDAKKNIQEDKDRESRANNIIIYRVPEGMTREETNKNDKAFCLELVKEVLGINVEESDFKAIFRLGKSETGKVRHILLQVREKTVKNQIMESVYKLKGADDKFKNISVTHDLTQKEREECKKLVEQAKKNQSEESGEFIWRVRGLPGQLKLIKIKKH